MTSVVRVPPVDCGGRSHCLKKSALSHALSLCCESMRPREQSSLSTACDDCNGERMADWGVTLWMTAAAWTPRGRGYVMIGVALQQVLEPQHVP